MFDLVLRQLDASISIQHYTILRSDIKPGRSSHEQKITLFIKDDEETFQLMDVLFFSGINPYYQPWIELIYSFDFTLISKNLSLQFFDSLVEKRILELFCTCLPNSAKIFVSYEPDDETRIGLMHNIPEVITRLGFLLFSFDFTWFKDWYFPEGGFEGGQKLQGEKAIDDAHRSIQLHNLYTQVCDFVSSKTHSSSLSSIEKKAFERGKSLLES